MSAMASNRQRICSITHEYFPKDRRVLKQSLALQQVGYEVDVLCIRDAGQRRVDEHDGIRIYRVPLRKKRGSRLRYVFEFLYGFVLFGISLNILFLKRRYTAIQVSNIPNFYVFAALIPRLAGCKVVLDMHEMMPELFRHRYALAETSPIHRALLLEEYLSTKFCHHVITVTDALARVVQARNGLPTVSVVMNTAPPSAAAPQRSVDSSRAGPRIIFHGILTNTYRLTTAIDAIKSLEGRMTCSLDIYGDGNLLADLQSFVADNDLQGRIHFKGFQPEEVIAAKAGDYDMAVAPLDDNVYSRYAFASKVSQYILMGIPVLCSDVACMRDYFDDEAVLYFDASDPASLAAQIERLYLALPDLGVRMTARARQQHERISWEVMSERYVSVFGGAGR